MALLKRQAWILLPLLSLISSSVINTSHGSGIGIYWGQNKGDGTLADTCNTGKYEVVNIAYLTTFGCKKTPALELSDHCASKTDCTNLASQIEHCQKNRDVRVYLSLGGPSTSYSLCDPADVKEVATFLYDNFLVGKVGLLGNVVLDGIDFSIQTGSANYWDDLAKELDELRYTQMMPFSLSAAPHCYIPAPLLHKAILTGVFDDIYVRFYDNPSCEFDGTTALLLRSWRKWARLVKSSSLYIGLPASPNATLGGGYIEPARMVNDVLPDIKRTPNYGGVMLWDRSSDIANSYSEQIRRAVSVRVLQSVTVISDAISKCVSAALDRFLPKPKALYMHV